MILSLRRWPVPTFDDIKQRARILVIDDQEFSYLKSFRREGYAIEKWNTVKNLSDLENARFDVVLLDLQGVAKKESAEDGLGVLKHIRTACPHQFVVAYSSAEFALHYQPFFNLADAILSKTADFPEFKRVVDGLLESRFSLGFYLKRASELIGEESSVPHGFRRRFEKAVTGGSTDSFSRYLLRRIRDPEVVKRVLALASVAKDVAQIWMS